MLQITIELWPHGKQVEDPIVWTGVITNTGTGTLTKGNYKAIFSQKNVHGLWKQSFVEGFSRKRNNVWELLRDLLNNIDG